MDNFCISCNDFCNILGKSIIGKQHGQGGGKWWLINLKHQAEKRENNEKSRLLVMSNGKNDDYDDGDTHHMIYIV